MMPSSTNLTVTLASLRPHLPLQATPHGLTSQQAAERLIQYGANKLPESTRNAFLVFLGYMWNPLAWAMEVAAIISIGLLDYADFALIVALLLVNSGISYVEESNADQAIKASAWRATGNPVWSLHVQH